MTSTETKAAPAEEEKKIRSLITGLLAVVHVAMEPWMGKRRTKILDRLMQSVYRLEIMATYLTTDVELFKRQILIATLVYHCDLRWDPFSVVKLKGESLWDRLRKSLGKEHQAQVDELYTALKAYVEPVALQFISAK